MPLSFRQVDAVLRPLGHPGCDGEDAHEVTHPDGVWMVELASLTDSTALPVRRVIGALRFDPGVLTVGEFVEAPRDMEQKDAAFGTAVSTLNTGLVEQAA